MPDLPDSNVTLDEEWEDDIPPVAGGLIGETLADLEMHAEARAVLLNLLVRDPTVTSLFDRWIDATPVGRLACQLGEHLHLTACTAGFPTVHDLMKALDSVTNDILTIPLDVADEAEAARVAQTVRDLLAEGENLFDAYVTAVGDLETTPLFDEVAVLVRDEWRLPWPWLAWELLRFWLNWLSSAPFGKRHVVNFWTEPNDLGQPGPTITFATRPGESIVDAMQRAIDEVFTPLEEAAQAAQLPTGRRTNPEIVQRYTEWWYRHRILGDSMRTIAEKDEGKRKLVRHGIGQAERWLGIVNATWKDEAA